MCVENTHTHTRIFFNKVTQGTEKQLKPRFLLGVYAVLFCLFLDRVFLLLCVVQ